MSAGDGWTEEAASTHFTFGKYRGKAVEAVVAEDPQYVLWAARNVSHFNPSAEHLRMATVNSEENDREEDAEMFNLFVGTGLF